MENVNKTVGKTTSELIDQLLDSNSGFEGLSDYLINCKMYILSPKSLSIKKALYWYIKSFLTEDNKYFMDFVQEYEGSVHWEYITGSDHIEQFDPNNNKYDDVEYCVELFIYYLSKEGKMDEFLKSIEFFELCDKKGITVHFELVELWFGKTPRHHMSIRVENN